MSLAELLILLAATALVIPDAACPDTLARAVATAVPRLRRRLPAQRRTATCRSRTCRAWRLSGPASPADAPPTEYGLLISLPRADRAELAAVTTQATDSQGAVDISVAGKTWGLPIMQAPLTNGWFTIMLPSHSEVLQLQRILTASD